MEKKKTALRSNMRPAFKDNRICCFEPKQWTFIIGWLGLSSWLLIGVIGTVAAYSGWINIFKLQGEDGKRAMIEHGGAMVVSTILWMFAGLGVLMHVLLLMGNYANRSDFFDLWLPMTWAGLIPSTLAVAAFVIVYSPPVEAFVKVVVYVATMGFPLYVVQRRYNELRLWERKIMDLEGDVEAAEGNAERMKF